MSEATYKQINFIRNLLEDKCIPFSQALDLAGIDQIEGVTVPHELTSWQASQLIEWLKEQDQD